MSSLAFPAPMGRAGGVRPRHPKPQKARSREPRRRPPLAAEGWPSWTDEVRVCTPGPESVPIEGALLWGDDADRARYAITRLPKGR